MDSLGYHTEIKQVEPGIEYAGLADGSVDASLAAWLPTTHGSYWEKYDGEIEKIGMVTKSVELGLTVPTYMEDINSIEDLTNNKNGIGEKLNWKITGISPGAGEMKLTKNDVMPAYKLNDKWKLQESSGPGMSAALKAAIDRKDPIVVTLWTPH